MTTLHGITLVIFRMTPEYQNGDLESQKIHPVHSEFSFQFFALCLVHLVRIESFGRESMGITCVDSRSIEDFIFILYSELKFDKYVFSEQNYDSRGFC